GLARTGRTHARVQQRLNRCGEKLSDYVVVGAAAERAGGTGELASVFAGEHRVGWVIRQNPRGGVDVSGAVKGHSVQDDRARIALSTERGGGDRTAGIDPRAVRNEDVPAAGNRATLLRRAGFGGAGGPLRTHAEMVVQLVMAAPEHAVPGPRQ